MSYSFGKKTYTLVVRQPLFFPLLLAFLFSGIFSCNQKQSENKPTSKTEIKGKVIHSLSNLPMANLPLKIITDRDEYNFSTNENGEYHFKKDLSGANIILLVLPTQNLALDTNEGIISIPKYLKGSTYFSEISNLNYGLYESEWNKNYYFTGYHKKSTYYINPNSETIQWGNELPAFLENNKYQILMAPSKNDVNLFDFKLIPVGSCKIIFSKTDPSVPEPYCISLDGFPSKPINTLPYIFYKNLSSKEIFIKGIPYNKRLDIEYTARYTNQPDKGDHLIFKFEDPNANHIEFQVSLN
jgi:hypothetical protein